MNTGWEWASDPRRRDHFHCLESHFVDCIAREIVSETHGLSKKSYVVVALS